eukprot:XP_001708934.1 Hypothetical protein GL50803_20179 [Giardia lamblia ATCC 50803]
MQYLNSHSSSSDASDRAGGLKPCGLSLLEVAAGLVGTEASETKPVNLITYSQDSTKGRRRGDHGSVVQSNHVLCNVHHHGSLCRDACSTFLGPEYAHEALRLLRTLLTLLAVILTSPLTNLAALALNKYICHPEGYCNRR